MISLLLVILTYVEALLEVNESMEFESTENLNVGVDGGSDSELEVDTSIVVGSTDDLSVC